MERRRAFNTEGTTFAERAMALGRRQELERLGVERAAVQAFKPFVQVRL